MDRLKFGDKSAKNQIMSFDLRNAQRFLNDWWMSNASLRNPRLISNPNSFSWFFLPRVLHSIRRRAHSESLNVNKNITATSEAVFHWWRPNTKPVLKKRSFIHNTRPNRYLICSQTNVFTTLGLKNPYILICNMELHFRNCTFRGKIGFTRKSFFKLPLPSLIRS